MINDSFHCLGGTSVDDFLNQYWQKKPLLIRKAFPESVCPISADELAGLACEEHVNARIVLEKDGTKPWQLEHGPFKESRFESLPETHWSLLVSDVEKHLPETKFLLTPFRFIPDWRIDDLMISYAPIGGSVGAHTDAYDVFLIQLSGQRSWKIAEHFSDEILDNTDLCILKEFNAEQEWVLNAGDMLYLPPNVAHHGIAQEHNGEHCMTASVGFRAPSIKTISSEYIQFINENTDRTERYQDKSPIKPTHHAEISEDTVSHFIEELQKGMILEREQVKRWLGQYCSDNQAFENIANEQQNLDFDALSNIANKASLGQSPYSHFLFSLAENTTLLFVDGECHEVSHAFAKELCRDARINFKQLQSIMNENDKKTLVDLYNNGSIVSV